MANADSDTARPLADSGPFSISEAEYHTMTTIMRKLRLHSKTIRQVMQLSKLLILILILILFTLLQTLQSTVYTLHVTSCSPAGQSQMMYCRRIKENDNVPVDSC